MKAVILVGGLDTRLYLYTKGGLATIVARRLTTTTRFGVLRLDDDLSRSMGGEAQVRGNRQHEHIRH